MQPRLLVSNSYLETEQAKERLIIGNEKTSESKTNRNGKEWKRYELMIP
jgi:hypothetical protein